MSKERPNQTLILVAMDDCIIIYTYVLSAVSDMNLWPQETFTSYLRDVPADAGFLYDKETSCSDKIKVDTKQDTVTYCIPQPSLANQEDYVPGEKGRKKNCSW